MSEISWSGGGLGDSSEDDSSDAAEPRVVPMKTTAILREPTYANAVVQRQMRRDEESHYANADVKNTSPWIGGGGGGGSRRRIRGAVAAAGSRVDAVDGFKEGGGKSDGGVARTAKRCCSVGTYIGATILLID